MRYLAFAIFFNLILLGCLPNLDMLMQALATSSQINSTNNFTNQVAQQLKNVTSNQSSDLNDIKKLLTQEVQLLKSISEGASKTTTQASFATLGVFFMGTALVIYGLRLTLGASDRRTSRYLKGMILGLTIPVIALLIAYQIGIPIYKSDDSFYLVSILLFVPVAMIVFLLIAEGRLIAISRQKDNQQ
jgi:hypothetical protein